MNREQWLNEAAEFISHELDSRAGLQLESEVRFGVGLLKKGVVGMCYDKDHSDSGQEITISLEQSDTIVVLGTLIHECIHACGIKNHRKEFKDAAVSMGLIGPAKSAGLSELNEIPDYVLMIRNQLGDYPGVAFERVEKEKNSNNTTIKKECEACGLNFRVSKKWAEFSNDCPSNTCEGNLI